VNDPSRAAEQNAAVEFLAAVARQHGQARTPEAKDRIRRAVGIAREAGVGWARIGETLGIARGNAYQRYRPRPGTREVEATGK
jgi:hypothetical protein